MGTLKSQVIDKSIDLVTWNIFFAWSWINLVWK